MELRSPTFVEVHAVPLRDRLPELRVPLRPSDEDVTLNLQTLIEQAYRNGRYDSIDYASEPIPPLEPDDAAWADALLKSAAKR